MNEDGCLFCHAEYDFDKKWLFSSEFESFFHPECLENQSDTDDKANAVRKEIEYGLT